MVSVQGLVALEVQGLAQAAGGRLAEGPGRRRMGLGAAAAALEWAAADGAAFAAAVRGELDLV